MWFSHSSFQTPFAIFTGSNVAEIQIEFKKKQQKKAEGSEVFLTNVMTILHGQLFLMDGRKRRAQREGTSETSG